MEIKIKKLISVSDLTLKPNSTKVGGMNKTLTPTCCHDCSVVSQDTDIFSVSFTHNGEAVYYGGLTISAVRFIVKGFARENLIVANDTQWAILNDRQLEAIL